MAGFRAAARTASPAPDDPPNTAAEPPAAAMSAAKVAALQAPGQVILKLAATGFGVRLPG